MGGVYNNFSILAGQDADSIGGRSQKTIRSLLWQWHVCRLVGADALECRGPTAICGSDKTVFDLLIQHPRELKVNLWEYSTPKRLEPAGGS